MRKTRMLRSVILGTLLAVLTPLLAFSQHFDKQDVVLTAAPAPTPAPPPFIDPNLQNPWGLSAGYNPTTATKPFGPSNWWISDENNGLSTLYNGVGQLPTDGFQAFAIPKCSGTGAGSPTGQVFSGSVTEFAIPQLGGLPSRFIFATRDGSIAAWNPGTGTTENPTVFPEVKNCTTASYTGITIIDNGGKQFLLAANFKTGKIDCFDTKFTACTFATSTTGNISPSDIPDGTFPSDSFTDTTLVADAGTTVVPFNVQAVGTLVYVTFVEKNATGGLVTGANTGSVDAFTVQGKLVRQFGKVFNAPWGVAQAGVFFGAFSHALLIGNHGDGTINAFDSLTGRSLGKMLTADTATKTNLVIPGLFGLQFGNDAAFVVATPQLKGSGPAIDLYFTASNESGLTSKTGVLGRLTPIEPELAGFNVY